MTRPGFPRIGTGIAVFVFLAVFVFGNDLLAQEAAPAPSADPAVLGHPATPAPLVVPAAPAVPPAPAVLATPAPTPDAPALFQRIVMLGASVTAGFDESQPFGGAKAKRYRFANYIEAALAGKHEPVMTQANAMLFLSPVATMDRQVTATLAAKPTLVIGLDALFWFCYGPGLREEQRRARFESGLKQLDRIHAPLLVGDLPDASKAVGGILSKEEVPAIATIQKCNERLVAWAAAHKNTAIFPVSKLMAGASANEEVTLVGHTWAVGETRALLREDGLHPSQRGLAGLALMALDAAGGLATPPIPAGSFGGDLAAIYTAGTELGNIPEPKKAPAAAN